MNRIRLFVISTTLATIGFATLLNAQPLPYPDVPTSSDTEGKTKEVNEGSSNDNGSSSDGGTQGVVSINNGGKSVFAVGSFDVKFEGSNVAGLSQSAQNYSQSEAGID